MIPTLIVLGLLALGVGIVAFATRRPPTKPDRLPTDDDVAWNDPVTPANAAPTADDPFAHAPVMTPPVVTEAPAATIPQERAS